MQDWRRAPLGALRCSPKRLVVRAESRNSAEMDGLGLGWSGRRCCATCLPTKPTIAARFACSRISLDFRCRNRWDTDFGIGTSYGRNPGHVVVLAKVLDLPPATLSLNLYVDTPFCASHNPPPAITIECLILIPCPGV